MGLDNSVYLHTKQPLNFIELPDNISIYCDKRSECEYRYEIIYFRKSWAFRSMMYNILANNGIYCDNNCGTFEFPASKKIIRDIQDGLYNFLKNPDEWDDGSQVFFIKDVYTIIAAYIILLSRIIKHLPKLNDAYMTFVDSW